MSKTPDPLTLAIDGGTTNTRARLFRGETLIAVAARAVGVRNVAIGGTKDPLLRAVADCVAEATAAAGVAPAGIDLACASGMLTSNVGLREVAHVAAPAGIDDLARHVVVEAFPEIFNLAIHLVPGVKTAPSTPGPSDLSQVDILRGEESETFGILSPTGRRGPIHLLLPGSHTKLVCVDAADRIAASYTTIAGEVMQALAEHTILSGSIAWPPPLPPDWSAVDRGADFAARWGLLRGAFAVRLSDVVLREVPAARTWFFVGVVVAADVEELTRASFWSGTTSVLVGGREPLRSVYARLLARRGHGAIQCLDAATVETAAARGALAIATRSTTAPGSG
jgi:2-dehydro-3-deoxygalactonokinase